MLCFDGKGDKPAKVFRAGKDGIFLESKNPTPRLSPAHVTPPRPLSPPVSSTQGTMGSCRMKAMRWVAAERKKAREGA